MPVKALSQPNRCRIRSAVLHVAWLGLLIPALNAAEPSVTPTNAAPVASSTSNAPETSAWLESFPSARRRQLEHAGVPRAIIVFPPEQHWRGELILIPAGGNAVHQQGPLLALAERLSQSGWRCWLVARETASPHANASASGATIGAPLTTMPGIATLPTQEELSALQSLISAEPAPSDVSPLNDGAPNGTRLPRFLLAQRDAAALAWQFAGAERGDFAGIVLLAAGPLPEQAPKQPVLDVQLPDQAGEVKAAAAQRQRRWQTLPQYQQQSLQTSRRIPIVDWLSHQLDGWLRKTAAQVAAAAADEAMKKQMTAQPTGKPAARSGGN